MRVCFSKGGFSFGIAFALKAPGFTACVSRNVTAFLLTLYPVCYPGLSKNLSLKYLQ
jgi:hypothetical protein